MLFGKIFRRCFAIVVLPEHVAPLGNEIMSTYRIPGGEYTIPYSDEHNPILELVHLDYQPTIWTLPVHAT